MNRGFPVTLLFAWVTGAGLTYALHDVQFGLPGSAWWFGLAAGVWEGLLGHWMNGRALRGKDARSIGWALGGGMFRMAVLVLAWRIGSGWLWPEQAAAWCMLVMYVAMMIAGIFQVARTTR